MPDDTDDASAESWEARYTERRRLWSGNANAALVDVTSDLTTGSALDLGCGEGGDAVWLAEQGWQVTGVDISATAIDRARELARTRGVPDGRIAWVQADLREWRPDSEYDLVSACFLHSHGDFPRDDVLRRAAAAVRRGGHLLVVGHAEPPPWASAHEEHDHPTFVGPDDDFAALRLGDGWERVVADVRSRDATGPDGERATLVDSVLLLRRPSPPRRRGRGSSTVADVPTDDSKGNR